MKNVMLSCGLLLLFSSIVFAGGFLNPGVHNSIWNLHGKGICPMCFGKGKLSVSSSEYHPDDAFGPSIQTYTLYYDCTFCNGTGQVGGQTKSAPKPKPNNNSSNNNGKNIPQPKINNPTTPPAPPMPKPNKSEIPPKPGESQFKAVMPQYLPGIPSQSAPFGATYKIVLFGDSNSYYMNVYNKLIALDGYSKNWFEFGEVFRSRNNAYLWDLYNRNTKTYLYVTPQLGVFDAWGRQAGILIKVG